jgi:alkanesulfonate monooxygenase SsuD/methylene tetrahydromethanopterin reductase-like flavin-dependent oxidoreductase (luciferase family)
MIRIRLVVDSGRFMPHTDGMKMMWFHLMPYPALPEDFNKKHRSVWVDIDPALFDRDILAETYDNYIDQLVYAEECGFDGICVNEHHNNGYGLMPSPNLIASILANRTSRAAITVLGNSVALYNPPVRIAEEFAMLDLFSRGRLIAGFPVGTSMDTAYSYGSNPGSLRPRYYEGIDLIVKAWTAEKAFSYNGQFNQQRYVNPVPRPWQKPHPPIWIPGGYKMVRETVGNFWRQVEAAGKDANPHRLAVTQFIGVADTDAEAQRLYKEPAEYFFNRSLHVYPGYTDPPGYVTEASVRARYKSQVRQAARAKQAKHDLTWTEMLENGYVVIGSPDTVREQLEEAGRELNIGHMCAMLQFGNMSNELTRYNTQMFGEKVAPALRQMFSEWDDPWWPENAR